MDSWVDEHFVLFRGSSVCVLCLPSPSVRLRFKQQRGAAACPKMTCCVVDGLLLIGGLFCFVSFLAAFLFLNSFLKIKPTVKSKHRPTLVEILIIRLMNAINVRALHSTGGNSLGTVGHVRACDVLVASRAAQ